jgi:hypothetical protein
MQASENLVWGVFCQGGAPRVLSIFLSLSFFVRPGSLHPDPRWMAPAARRSGQGWRVSGHRKAFVLDGSEHDGTLAVVGDDDIEGSPRVVHEYSCHILVFGGLQRPDHDAVMRIGCEAPRRRTHSAQRHQSRGFHRDPATSNRHRRPVASVGCRRVLAYRVEPVSTGLK